MAPVTGRGGRGRLGDPWSWGVPLAAVLLALLVWAGGGNEALFLALNRGLPGSDGLWASLTSLGDAAVALGLLLPFVGRRPRVVLGGVLSALLATLCVQTLKSVLALPRPAAVLDPGLLRIIGPEIHTRSFPSGHTATAFVLAGIIVLALRPSSAWRWGLLSLAAAVGLSRIAVGAHWPLDVLAGAALGWAAAIGGHGLIDHFRAGLGTAWQRLFAGLCLLATVDVVFVSDAYPEAGPFPRLIALAALALSLRPMSRLFRPHRAGGSG